MLEEEREGNKKIFQIQPMKKQKVQEEKTSLVETLEYFLNIPVMFGYII